MLCLNYFQAVFQWLPYPALPIMMIFTIGLMASIGFVILRYRYRLLFGFASRWLNWRDGGAPSVAERVLIVGSGEGSKIANWLLKQGETSRILSIIGVIDDEQPSLMGMRVKGNTMLGGTAKLGDLIEKYDVGVVLFATPKASADFTDKISDICNAHGVRMVMLTDLLALLQNQLTQPVKQHSVNLSSTYIRESP
jgi:FlaA1/EpsC-like NDP-sugar epimerase